MPEWLTEWFKQFAGTYLAGIVLNLIFAFLELFIGLKLVKFLTSRLQLRKIFTKMDSNISALILNSTKIILNAAVIIIAVQIVGVPSATIVAAIGSCGLAIGLALQGGLSNLAGGVMIMIFKPFHYNDYISTQAGEGNVEEIGLFYTKLVTIDGKSVNIPNSILSSTTVTNLSAKPTRGMDIDISVAYGSDIETARKALLDCAGNNPLILKDPEPKVFVVSHDDFAIRLILRVSVLGSDYWQVRFDLYEKTLKALEDAKIEIPFPQMDVHMKQ